MQGTLVLVFLGVLVFLSHLFARLFARKGVPDVLLLLLVGLIAGPLGGWVVPDDFGPLAGLLGSMTLVIIIFQAGLDLRIDEIRGALRGGALMTLGTALTSLTAGALVGYLALQLPLLSSLTLGAVVAGIAAAVVLPLIARIPLSGPAKASIVLEAAFTDVLCIVISLALVQAYQADSISVWHLAGSVLSAFIVAGLLGCASAFAWGFLLEHVRGIENAIFTTPAYLFIVYGLAELLGFSGVIAILAFAMSLANLHLLHWRWPHLIDSHFGVFNKVEKQFFAELSFLLRTFFFVFMGSSLRLDNGQALTLGALLTLALYLMRIPVVRLSMGKRLPPVDLRLMAILAPRGLASAVLAGVPAQVGMPGGDTIRDIAYAVILVSIIFTSLLIALQNRWKGLRSLYSWLLGSGWRDQLPEAQPNESVTPLQGPEE